MLRIDVIPYQSITFLMDPTSYEIQLTDFTQANLATHNAVIFSRNSTVSKSKEGPAMLSFYV